MTQQSVNELTALLPLLIQIVGLIFAVLVDSYLDKRQKRVMLIVAALAFALVVENYWEYLMCMHTSLWYPRLIAAICGYAIRPAILVLFCHIVSPRRNHWRAWAVVGLNAAIHATALFSDICFTINTENHYQGGPLAYACEFFSAILLADLVYLTFKEYRHVRRQELVIPAFVVAAIIVSYILDTHVTAADQIEQFLTIAIVSCCLLYYIWLHMQFVREHERALEAEQRIQIMMTQIQPHFLYNTISTISALCYTEPQRAGRIADSFGLYLRQNLDSLGTVGLIPFRDELAHTKTYTDIEMTRFETIRIEYDIRDEDFSVPPLTLQPIVENAIRHGAFMRDEGIVQVSARRTVAGHEITVWDNGAGFDPRRLKEGDGQHIGLWNVRERLERMCGGSLDIDSGKGNGTTVTITLPVAKEEEDHAGNLRR
ncbi:MAG: histidine kinase [Clostridia bacterium]|nr:histidine kinase [Clostridia bacterium]